MARKTAVVGGIGLPVWLLLVCVGCNRPAEAGAIKVQELTPAAQAPTALAGTSTQGVALSYSFAIDMNRNGAVEERGVLICRIGNCAKGIVAFGPYTRAVPAGSRVANFRVSGLGVSNLDAEVASFDVYNAQDNQRLGLRSVKGTELPDGQERAFEVAFAAPKESTLEFRVGWAGEGELKMYRVDVR